MLLPNKLNRDFEEFKILKLNIIWNWSFMNPGSDVFDTCFYRTWVRSLFSIVSNKQPHRCFGSLTDEDAYKKDVDVGVGVEESVGYSLVTADSSATA